MAESSNSISYPNLEAEVLDRRVDEFIYQTDELEKMVKTVMQRYESNEGLTDGAQDESAISETMQDLMHEFGVILRQIMKHKCASPFIKPVDAEGLGLYDYYEVIKEPMDLGTILNRMESKEESSRYKNVSDICADVRLVFNNAMQYNEPGTCVHAMAKELSSEFEEKWCPLSLEVAEEERRQEQDEEQAAIDRLVQDTYKLMELRVQLEELRRNVMQSYLCRKMSKEEKLILRAYLGKLSVEDLKKAIEIGAKFDPDLDVSSRNFDIVLDSMNEDALWRVYNFVQKALKRQEWEQQAKMDRLFDTPKGQIRKLSL